MWRAFYVKLSLVLAFCLWLISPLYRPEQLLESRAESNREQCICCKDEPQQKGEEEEERPNDWLYIQRAYPYDSIPLALQHASMKFASDAARAAAKSPSYRLAPSWQLAGPTNIPGRINDIVANPDNPAEVYAGSSTGGIFKSTDSGATWVSVFDAEGSQPIGALAMHPTDHNIIYAGTGDPSAGSHTYAGTGMYKSTDGGATWTNIGLENSFYVARIVIDPLRPETIFVAAAGRLYGGGGGERGVYRSVDGGTTWQQKLWVSDTTACIDIAYHPSTGTLFAAMWERVRYLGQTPHYGGPTSNIYKSSNHGETWILLGPANGLLGWSDLGRIGLAADPGSNTIYAQYSQESGGLIGVYRSDNLGVNWHRVNDATLIDAPLYGGWSGGYYFGQIRVSPGHPNTAYAMGVDMFRTNDSGASWSISSVGTHVDHHALWINPNDPSFLYDGSDGGVCLSRDGGHTWRQTVNQPSTELYAVEIDPSLPWRLYGGAQDNAIMRTRTGSANDYQSIISGDGFYVAVDRTDYKTFYVEAQNGTIQKTTNDGASFENVMPLESWGYGNRCTPFIIDPSNHLVLYYGANVVYRTADGASTWTAISGDLTGGPHPPWAFGTITSIDVSPTDSAVIYAGTDNGKVWVTQDLGGTWARISDLLPNRWVTRVAVDPHHANIAYVTYSGHQEGNDAFVHIYRTEDYGANWTAIASGLPDSPINDVIPDPADSLRLYIGADFGVYTTSDLGASWSLLAGGMPSAVVLDLDYDANSQMLVAGTFGRSMYKIFFGQPVACCTGTTGNVNMLGIVDVSDLSLLVAYLTTNPSPNLPCPAEANVNNSGIIDVSDLSLLAAYLTMNPPPSLPGCP